MTEFEKKADEIRQSAEQAKAEAQAAKAEAAAAKAEAEAAKSELAKRETELKTAQTNIDNLGLEELGITTERGKINVDEWYRTNVPGIYAIGDIVHGPALAHKADHEATICVEKLCGLNPKPLNYANIPGCTYTTPEIASVGMSEAKAIAAGYEVKIGKFPFTASGKATAAGNRDGFIKVVFDAKTGDWLGCHMVGDNVTEMVAAAVLCRELGAKGEDIIHAVFPHPTMSEGIMEAAAAAYNECVHL